MKTAEEIVEVNDDENEVVGDLNAPNKDTNTEKDIAN